jgi:hypothetical protein
LRKGAVLAKEKVLKLARAPESGGYRRGDTELDEQGDEDDARVEHGFRVQRSACRVQGARARRERLL